MKNYFYFISILAIVIFVSCDDLKDAVEVGIRTEIEADIPVISQKIMAIELKSQKIENDVYHFIGGGIISLSDIPKLKNYIDNISNIVAEDGSSISFNGVTDGDKVLTLKLKYGIQSITGEGPAMDTALNHSGEIIAQNNLIEYLNDSWAPVLIGAFDADKDKVFAIILEGTANYNVNSTVKLKIPVKVSAKPLQN